jgi:hypothetical protein
VSIKGESVSIGEDVDPASASKKSIMYRDIGTVACSCSTSVANDIVCLKVASLNVGISYELETMKRAYNLDNWSCPIVGP